MLLKWRNGGEFGSKNLWGRETRQMHWLNRLNHCSSIQQSLPLLHQGVCLLRSLFWQLFTWACYALCKVTLENNASRNRLKENESIRDDSGLLGDWLVWLFSLEMQYLVEYQKTWRRTTPKKLLWNRHYAKCWSWMTHHPHTKPVRRYYYYHYYHYFTVEETLWEVKYLVQGQEVFTYC